MGPLFQNLSDSQKKHGRSCGLKVSAENGYTNRSCIQNRDFQFPFSNRPYSMPQIFHRFDCSDHGTNRYRKKHFASHTHNHFIDQFFPVLILQFPAGIFQISLRYFGCLIMENFQCPDYFFPVSHKINCGILCFLTDFHSCHQFLAAQIIK